MQRSSIRKLTLGLAVLSVAAFLLFRPGGDARKIHRSVRQIQKLVAKTPAETDLAGLASARKIAAYFTDPFSVRAESERFETRDRAQLIAAIHRYRSRSSTLFLRVYDQELALGPADGEATLSLTAEFVRGAGDLAGADRYPMLIRWRRLEGEWRIGSVEIGRPF